MINNTIDGNPTIPDDFELQKLTPGRTLCEKYRLENEAGVGGMGVVWKAWDLVAERPVALKFIPPEIRHSEPAMKQVKTVFQTVQALNHQNIGPIYGLEKDPAFGYFIVKKWLEGQTLDEMKLPPARIPDVLAKVADALDYAHSKRVMHRDVKPSNIFIETNGDVLLNDFGIAAEIQNSISLNTSSNVCRTSGTRPYMAPEQWKGQRQDGQTDQYALGVLAYQLYSGRLPFDIQDPLLLRMAVLQDIPEPIENVPDSVNAAILRALSKDRKDRFATCREFIDALTGTIPLPAASSPHPVPPSQPPAHKLPPTPRSSFVWDGAIIKKFVGKETKVVIPEGVTEIGDWAFSDCSSLTSVVIPEGVWRIGAWAFYGCSSLTSVVIPKGVTVIGGNAFEGCSSLTSVVIPEGVTVIGGNAFEGCSSLTSVVIPEGVTVIGDNAFEGCSSLTSVVIPEGVTKIGEGVFCGCSSLTSVVIPRGVTDIGKYAFAGCTALKEWSISSGHPYFKTDGTGLLTKDGKKLVACLPSAKEYRIPKGVTGIGDWAFFYCSSLTSVVIPDSVKKIGIGAFVGCTALKEWSISSDHSYFKTDGTGLLTKDGKTLVACLASAKEYQIPEGVTEIGKEAFEGCSSLKSVVIPEGVKEIGNYAFRGCRSLTSVVIPEGVTEIGDQAFYICSSLTSVVIPEGVTKIGEHAFCVCSSLTSVVIPEGVTNIGNYTFVDCSSLASVVIPEGVTEIGSWAFSGCSSLKSVKIPKSVTTIGEHAFEGCPVPWYSRAYRYK